MNKFYFKKIKENEVDPETLSLAKKMLTFCKEKLNLPDEVYIQWIRSADKNSFEIETSLIKIQKLLDKSIDSTSIIEKKYHECRNEFWGRCFSKLSSRRNEIQIRSDISADEMLHVIAHECKHVHDHKAFKYKEMLNPFLEYDKWEKRADAFAYKIIKEFKNRKD